METAFVIVLMIIMFFAAATAIFVETEDKKVGDRSAQIFAASLVATLIMFMWG